MSEDEPTANGAPKVGSRPPRPDARTETPPSDLPTRTDGAAETAIRSARFRAEREADWRRLESLVDRAERRGVRTLDFEEARQLAVLYRQVVASLSVAREISLDRGLLDYLEALSARAYLAVYAPQESVEGVIGRFFARGAPQAFRRSALALLLALAALALGALAAWLLFFDDETWYNTIMPGGLAAGRGVGSTREDLLEAIYGGEDSPAGSLGAFAAYLFSHNTRIAIFAFALGIAACAPSFALAFYNGLILGVFVALHVDRGLGWDIFAWLSVHGVTELGAIVVATAGGFRLGFAVLFPGPYSRRAALRAAGPDAVKLALLAAVMLVAAAFLEGFARQWVTEPETRLAIGWGVGALWIAWLTLAGRGREAGR
ncbi:MAG: stage II sporulation protein M [Pseudomonadota bacterium]